MKFILAVALWCATTLTSAEVVKLIVPFAPGGVSDQVARAIEQSVNRRSSHQIVVEYMPGAGGMVAMQATAKKTIKTPTLVLVGPWLTLHSVGADAAFDPLTDFQPVYFVGQSPMVLVANKQAVGSVKDIVGSNKNWFYATAGWGTSTHLAGEVFSANTKTAMTPVWYKGEAQALNDVMSGQVPMSFVSLNTAAAQVNSDRVSILAITGSRRNPRLPAVATFREQQVSGMAKAGTWLGLVATLGTDLALVEDLQKTLAAVAQDPSDQEKFLQAGMEVEHSSAGSFSKFIVEEQKKMRELKTQLSNK